MIMFVLVGPLIALATLQVSVMVSSRANDPRSAQQLTSLLILPITVVFVAQLMGAFVIAAPGLLLAAIALLAVNGLLLLAGRRIFERETVLTRWK